MNLEEFKNSHIPAIVFAIVFVVGAIAGVIYYVRLEPDLKNSARLREIGNYFREETDAIGVPPKTAVNKTTGPEFKVGVYARMTTRYRTELDKGSFGIHFRNALKERGWHFRGIKQEDPFEEVAVFCKERYDGTLSLEPWNIWKDEGLYFQLTFRFGQRDVIGQGLPLPAGC